ncbi:MAG: PdaC/SigV domain-containing protein [Luteimonas sp.]
MKPAIACLLLSLPIALLIACQREASAPQSPASPPPPATGAPPAARAVLASPPLTDVSERDPRYLVGISYPPGLQRYPGLAAELQRYADGARAELKQAVAALGADKPSAPYDLSLSFSTVVDSPRIVAVAADGSTYTGGAHGNPLVARFVWLPEQNRLLKITDLVTDARGWRDLSDHVREQLHAALSQRIDADDLAPAERAEMMKSALKMIDQGSEPDAANFRQFEPVLGGGGRIVALRFVFPPYQVGPYSDGMQTVEVPVSVLRPHLAAAYAELFVAG